MTAMAIPTETASPEVSLEEAAAIMRRVEDYLAEDKLGDYDPYPWQRDFHNASADYPERMLMAANQVGKSMCAAAEVAIHMTGLYPPWWEGRRFDKPPLVWCGSINNEKSHDVVQAELIGGLAPDLLGRGWIPKRCIIGRPRTRQAGVPDVMDTLHVRHVSGGISTLRTKTYEQGWRTFQGLKPQIIWLDEEPEDYQVFTECETRMVASAGIILVTFTPLLGETTLVEHFFDPKVPGTYIKTATWDEAPHLDPESKARLRASYPEWELEARTMGVPMHGEGRVFTVPQSEIVEAPFRLADFKWYAIICGIDFGIDHPAAAVWAAWDRDADVIHIFDAYKIAGQTSVYHAQAVKSRGDWIPVAWPHDGMNREKSGGRTLASAYKEHGVKMLSFSARYDSKIGGPQAVEPVVLDMLERMKTGRLKVFSHLAEWFDEFRSYHRKDGRIVNRKDDLLKATMYAIMMKRYALTRSAADLKAAGKRSPEKAESGYDVFA